MQAPSGIIAWSGGAVLQEPRQRFSDYFYNGITFAGVLLSVAVFTLEATLWGIDFFSARPSLYLGLITYFLLPPFLFLGLLLIPAGALWKRGRVLKGLTARAPQSIVLDLSIPTHRNALIVFVAASSLVVIASVIGSYESYHYTESVSFCGQLCHQVMHPEFATYQRSPHARVKCVECHVGEGADSFLKSKLNGLHQVYALMTASYSRPVPTPVKNLRPARETCEQCHWPEHFFSAKERVFQHFLGDEKNTPWIVRMLMNIGGGGPKGVGETGIHWHMAIHNKMLYVPRGPDRQEIGWIKAISQDGKETVYSSKDRPLDPSKITPENQCSMDCMDCHNRPSHRFLSPAMAVDQALAGGRLDRTLPFVKAQAVKALAATYASDQEADQKIAEALRAFYRDKGSEVVSRTVQAVQNIYHEIQFPSMKANWKAHPNNIGHMEFPGCFRCHGSDLVSKEGKTLTRDCNACHTILSQGSGRPSEAVSVKGLEFRHPGDVEIDLNDAECTACHTGGADLY